MTDHQPIHKYGVYFLANDVVYDWTIALLNPFRTFNPDLPQKTDRALRKNLR